MLTSEKFYDLFLGNISYLSWYIRKEEIIVDYVQIESPPTALHSLITNLMFYDK